MWHIIGASRVLAKMRDAGHVVEDTSNEGGDDDNEGDDHDHDDEDGNHDASSSTTPSDHVCQGVSDPFSRMPPHQSPDDEMPELEDVPYVFPDIAEQTPPPPPQMSSTNIDKPIYC